MKNLVTTLFAVLLIAFLSSCGGDDCIACEGADPFFGISIEAEACDNGDGTITVTQTAAGISADTTFTGTLETFEAEFATFGDCN